MSDKSQLSDQVESSTNEPVTVQLINDFKLGLNYLGNNSKLLIIYCVQILILVGFMTSPVLLVPFAKNILHTNVSEFGQIDAALSVGVVTGGICIPWIAKRFGFVRSIVAMCLVLALCFSLFSINRDILIAGILYFCLGFGLSVWPLIVTQAQNVTHIDFQARVQSVFNSISGLLVLIMYLLVSLTSHFVSISYYYAFNVVFSLLAAFLLWYYRARFNSDDLDNALSSKNN